MLGASGSTEEITLETNTGAQSHHGQTVSLCVSSLGNNEKYASDVLSVPDIPVAPNLLPTKRDPNLYAHLSDISFPRVPGAKVSLLIGADHPDVFCAREVRRGARKEPIAIKTPLRWSLLGPSLSLARTKICHVNFVKVTDSLQHDINRLWESDFGCNSSVLDSSTMEDRLVYDLMHRSVSFVNGHYQLPLPRRPNITFPEDSLAIAQQRLDSLYKRLKRDGTLRQKYAEAIETYLKNNYARVVSLDELKASTAVWTLPHLPVYHPRKSKVRIVFDCAAKWRGVSFNDMLMQGPDLVSSLVGVLFRFRRESIALTADIECMFHQIRVHQQGVHALRLLWLPGGDLSLDPVLHQMQVQLFGATSSPSCATFCLRQTTTDFGNQFDPEISCIIQRNVRSKKSQNYCAATH